ncbi:MAG TPA: transglycosylase SLT domain-containing protein [Burkholderiales bacterium]|nr:transglycosylase SLT domain-containing protein [Burkholderiales bacterium]
MRIGSIHASSLSGGGANPVARWIRKVVSVVALAASTAALALIVQAQYSQPSDESPQTSQAAASEQAGGKQKDALSAAEESRYRALSDYLARRYRVSQDVAFDLVRHAHRVGGQLQLDPLLIIAIISVESSFNPIAESVAGAKGLMQIIPKYHGDKLEVFGGEQAVFDPATNIQVGAQILKEYIRYTGNLGSALQMYNGALGDAEDQYTNRVMGMKQRLQQVVSQPPLRSPSAPMRTASVRNASSAFPLQAD